MKVLYHASCNDGFCAAFLMMHYHGVAAEDCIPLQYDAPKPEGLDDVTYILDYSAPWMTNLPGEVIWCDHHASGEKYLNDMLGRSGKVYFDQSRSGAALTAKMLVEDHGYDISEHEWLIDYTEDRDLWRWRLPNSREINAGLSLLEHDYESWCGATKERMLISGEVLTQYYAKRVKQGRKHVGWWMVRGASGECVTLRGALCTEPAVISDLAGSFARDGIPGMTFFLDGAEAVYSLRGQGSRELAEKMGGGGHPRAAGFRGSWPYFVGNDEHS